MRTGQSSDTAGNAPVGPLSALSHPDLKSAAVSESLRDAGRSTRSVGAPIPRTRSAASSSRVPQKGHRQQKPLLTRLRSSLMRRSSARVRQVCAVRPHRRTAAVPTLARSPCAPAGAWGAPSRRLVGAHDLEGLADEYVVRPVDADVVDLVPAVAQLHDAVDDASRVGGQRSFSRFVRCRSADDRP